MKNNIFYEVNSKGVLYEYHNTPKTMVCKICGKRRSFTKFSTRKHTTGWEYFIKTCNVCQYKRALKYKKIENLTDTYLKDLMRKKPKDKQDFSREGLDKLKESLIERRKKEELKKREIKEGKGRTCWSCNTKYPESEYYNKGNICKKCHNERGAKYVEINKSKIKEYRKNHKKKSKDKISDSYVKSILYNIRFHDKF